jgi:hypothetical protein
MAVVRKTFAAATCSWIDPATGLPEVDEVPIVGATTAKAFLTGSAGFRFSNYMEVYVDIDIAAKKISGYGFTHDSKMHRGPSYLGIPSHAFDKSTEIFQSADAFRFTQTVGARTVSPEVIGSGGGVLVGAGAGALVGSVVPVIGTAVGAIGGGIIGFFAGDAVAHQAVGFPPIWSKIQIRMYTDGRVEAQLLQHSLFPSLTFYTQRLDAKGVPQSTFDKANHPNGSSYYNATKKTQLPDWQKNGWSNMSRTTTPGPCAGNPWGVDKGITGGSENLPN